MPIRPIPGAGRPASGNAHSPNGLRRVLSDPVLKKRQAEDIPIVSSVDDIVADTASLLQGGSRPTPTDDERPPSRTPGRPDDNPRNERAQTSNERPRATLISAPASTTTSAPRSTDRPSRSESEEVRTTTREPRTPVRTPTSTSTSTSAEETTTISLSVISLPTAGSSTSSSSASSTTSTSSESSSSAPTPSSTPSSSTQSPPTSSSITTSATPTSTANAAVAAPSKGEISETTVIVASVSATVALITIIFLIIFCVRRKRQKRAQFSKGIGSDTDSFGEYPDTAFLGHSRNTSSIIGSSSKQRSVNIVSQPPPSRRPMSVSAELSMPGPSPTALVHPPQGYTRPARVNTVGSSAVSSEPFQADRTGPLQPQDRVPESEAAAAANLTSPTRSYMEEHATPVTNRRSSLFLPTSASHPPPIRQQQQTVPSLQPVHTNYQAYKPFASRYQVPQTIPEEGAASTRVRRPSIDTSVARSFLPGEQTRSLTGGLPTSLAVGARS